MSSQPASGTSKLDSSDLRTKVVAILSDTANGCLSELGYHPGLLKRITDLEQTNTRWKEENVKLFQDNRALAQFSQRQDERIKELIAATPAAPENSGKVALLEEQLKALSAQNSELQRTNEVLTALSSTKCNDPAHQRLFTDCQQFKSRYESALGQVHQLRQQLQALSYNQQIVQHVVDPRQQQVATGQRLPQGYAAFPQQVSYNHAIPMGVHPQMPVYQNVTQNAPKNGASHQAWSSMQHYRVDRNCVPPMMAPLQPVPMTKIARSMPSHSSPTSPTNHTPCPHPSPVAAIAPTAYRRGSFTIQTPPSVPNSPLGPPSNSLQDQVHYSYDGGSWVVASPRTSQPNPMPMSQPTSGHRPASRTSSQIVLKPLSPATWRHTSIPLNDPVPHKSMSPSDSATLATPVSEFQEPSSIVIASSPVMGFDQMKRRREDVSDSSDAGMENKKIRLEEDNQVPTDVKMDDECEQEIEVDSDGFRSIASCISELVETGLENPELQKCRLCDVRYKNGVIPQEPKAFIRATQEDLLQHLTSEHAEAWEALRQDI